MTAESTRTEWLPRPIAFVAIGAALAGFAIQGFVGFRGAYLSHVSGIWLTLARDVADNGVLYRDLVSDLGYGGTRYFPLFFLAISSLLKLGVSAVTSGLLVGLASLAVLVTGAYRVARVSGAPPLTAGVFAAAAASPYFAVQAVFEIRADVMAAGFNVWGVALLLPLWKTSSSSSPSLGRAALMFALAFATKVTAVVLPITLIAAAVVTGRVRAAVRLGATLLAMVSAVLIVTQAASMGRAFRVWAACLFAGSEPGGTLSAFLSGGFLPGLLNSHLVVIVGGVAAVSLVAVSVVRATKRDGELVQSAIVPTAIWTGASITLGITLSSPGTVPANQVIEWLAVSILTVAIVAGSRASLRRIACVATAGLSVWMAVQNVSRAAEMRPLVTPDSLNQRQRLVDRIRTFDAPILTESALWPILAGREVVVPDPFALRVVMRGRPDIEALLIEEIARRKYAAIVLEFDPVSNEGRGMYEFVHFGRPVISAIESHYVLTREIPAGSVVFLPRATASRVDTPRSY